MTAGILQWFVRYWASSSLATIPDYRRLRGHHKPLYRVGLEPWLREYVSRMPITDTAGGIGMENNQKIGSAVPVNLSQHGGTCP